MTFLLIVKFNFRKSTQILYLSPEMFRSANLNFMDSDELDFFTSIELIFRSPQCINASFLSDDSDVICCTSKESGVDISKATEVFQLLMKVENESVQQMVNC